jgi:hypothetical protein
MSAAVPGAMGEQLVGEADHLQLARLVTEFAWRIGHGKAETVHELFVDEGEMTPGSDEPEGSGRVREWGRKRVAAPYRTRHVARICASLLTVTIRPRASLSSPSTLARRRTGYDAAEHGW